MPKIEKANRRDSQRRKKLHGMKVSGKRSVELILNAIKKKAK
jgi:hypothetical protein